MPERASVTLLDTLLPGEIANTASANSHRLIRTRWIAGGLVLAATALCVHGLGLPLPEIWLYGVGLFLLGYNALLAWLTARAERRDPPHRSRAINRLIIAHIALDWLCMAVFLHLTGGITSPAIPFFLIHMLMVTILLPGQSPYIYVVMGMGVLALIAVLEWAGVLPHYSVIPELPERLYTSLTYIGAQLFFITTTAFATVYLTSAMMARLRQRERQLYALFSATNAAASTLSLPDVMERLAQAAADALSMPGAAIRLLDETGERLVMTAAVGLSQSYLDKGAVDLSRSRFDEEALAGKPAIIEDAARDSRLQYPQQVVAEGIRSLLAVPIMGRGRALGVLRVYGDRTGAFSAADADLVMAIARQGAAALENALAHDALQKADAARGQFVRIVTHELRSPVGGAQSLIRTMIRGMAGELSELQRDIVHRIEVRLDHLSSLVDDLLALAASQMPDLQAPATRLPFRQAMESCMERWRPQAAEKHVTLEYSGPPEVLTVRGNQETLCRIFDNLIGNAVKYTPPDGKVTVRAVERLDNLVVTVSDTGIGIPEDDLPSLWEEFYRASNARASNIPGTGLGLSIVKRLVEGMGGAVGVSSEENVGTTFKVILPIVGPGSSE